MFTSLWGRPGLLTATTSKSQNFVYRVLRRSLVWTLVPSFAHQTPPRMLHRSIFLEGKISFAATQFTTMSCHMYM